MTVERLFMGRVHDHFTRGHIVIPTDMICSVSYTITSVQTVDLVHAPPQQPKVGEITQRFVACRYLDRHAEGANHPALMNHRQLNSKRNGYCVKGEAHRSNFLRVLVAQPGMHHSYANGVEVSEDVNVHVRHLLSSDG